ncbi:MAG TPA: ATP-binding protein [Pirellulaceae bacterium]|nr:ATP-binding protein [Pirellulaceae bacterium]
MTDTLNTIPQQKVHARAAEIFAERLDQVHVRTDRWFAWLMVAQYAAGVGVAWIVSPRTWAGTTSQVHIHVVAATFLGAVIVSLPIALAWQMPGRRLTRHVIAAGQMLMSALLIHLTGGRIETHFHVFGSLAFLAFYRDWKVLLTATAVVALDHFLRGEFWPQSVFGTLVASPYRWIEHAGWVLFEVWFLRLACLQNVREMRRDALQRAEIEHARELTEQEVAQRTADLARKNQELDEFTYVASHDLQEPVRKLISFSKLLEQDLGSELNEQAAKDVRFIVDAAGRMRDLIQDLLALSRTGRNALRLESIALDECVDRALDALDMRVQESGAEIVRDGLPTVTGDATLLTQLYQNLVGNALKFVEPGKRPCIRLTAARADGGWVLGVEDNGIGIKPEYAERIFRPFQRLHNRGEYEGTGIGLAICKKTVERHAGRIWVQSQPGAGSKFQFFLGNPTEHERCKTSAELASVL